MQPVINISMWVSLPTEVRYRIRGIFNIPRSSNTVVNDGRIETDGTTNEDFKHLTIAKMQDYLPSDSTDFHKLFDQVVARVTDEIAGVIKPELPIIKASEIKIEPVIINANPELNVKTKIAKKGKK